MGWRGHTMSILTLVITVLTLQIFSDAAAVSSRLPTHILMQAIIKVQQEPLNLDHLSVVWEHDGRPLVEYNDNQVTTHEPRVLMPQEQFKDGNFSLILMHVTQSDSGNYSCLIQYDKQQQMVLYALLVEKLRIQLLDLTPKPEKNTDNEPKTELKMRTLKKFVRESRPNSKMFLHIGGYSPVTVTPGNNVSLMCRFHTDPSMELTMLDIRWSKDGVTKWVFNKNLLNDEAKVTEVSNGHATLNLASVQREDSGKYTCNIVYQTLEKNISTILFVNDENISLPVLQNNVLPAKSVQIDKYRKEKIGMVVGVVAAVNFFAFFIYLCVGV